MLSNVSDLRQKRLLLEVPSLSTIVRRRGPPAQPRDNLTNRKCGLPSLGSETSD